MKKLLSLLLLAGSLRAEDKAPEQEYNDFLTENNFEKCKSNITPQDVDELFDYVSSSEQNSEFADYKKSKDRRTKFAINIAECQQKPLHHEKYTCDQVMSKLVTLSDLYWIWQTKAQYKASEAIVAYKENIAQIARQTVDFETKKIIFQVAHDARKNDNQHLPPYKPRVIQTNNNYIFSLDEDALYNQLIACTDKSKNKKDCIAGLKDHANINRALSTKGNFVSGGGQLMLAFSSLGNDYLQNNVHGITSKDITK